MPHHHPSDQAILASTDVLRRFFAPAPPPPLAAVTTAAPASYSRTHTDTPLGGIASTGSAVANSATSTVPYGGGYSSVPGVPSSFAACVAMRESTNGAGSSNIYGILPMNGYSSGMSVAAQKQLFSQMYQAQGSAPWSQYDGC